MAEATLNSIDLRESSLKHRTTAVIATVVAVAFAVRMLFVGDFAIWFDEAFSWEVTNSESLSEVIELASGDVHPVFYYVVLWAWRGIAGDALLSLRFPSVVFGSLAAGLTTLLTLQVARHAKVAQPRVIAAAVAAGAFVILSPPCVRWSQETRMYSLLVFLAVLSTLLLLRYHIGNTSRWVLAMYVVVAGLLSHTHYFGCLFVACQLSIVAIEMLSARDSSQRRWEFLLACLSIAVIFLPWVSTLLHQLALVRQDYWIPSLSIEGILAVPAELLLGEETAAEVNMPMKGIIAAIGAVVLLFAIRSKNRAEQFLGLLITFQLVQAISISIAITPVLWPRYLIANVPLWFVLFCLQASRFSALRSVALAFLALPCLLLGGVLFRQQSRAVAREGAAPLIEDLVQPGTSPQAVIVTKPFLLFEVRYYLRHDQRPRHVAIVGEQKDVLFYNGSPLLKPQDVISPGRLSELESRIWLFDSDAWEQSYQDRTPKGFIVTNTPSKISSARHDGWSSVRRREIKQSNWLR